MAEELVLSLEQARRRFCRLFRRGGRILNVGESAGRSRRVQAR